MINTKGAVIVISANTGNLHIEHGLGGGASSSSSLAPSPVHSTALNPTWFRATRHFFLAPRDSPALNTRWFRAPSHSFFFPTVIS